MVKLFCWWCPQRDNEDRGQTILHLEMHEGYYSMLSTLISGLLRRVNSMRYAGDGDDDWEDPDDAEFELEDDEYREKGVAV